MILKVIATGSKGNSYALMNDKEILLIEAGVPFKKVKEAIDFRVADIVGCIITHEHLDHAKYEKQYKNNGFPVSRKSNDLQCRLFNGSFDITAFNLEHDDVPCHGFRIIHKDIGQLLFITDTQHVKYIFICPDHIVVEANYQKELIDKSQAKRKHVFDGHMEINTTRDFIWANNSKHLKSVTLIHLSEESSDEQLFREKIEEIVDCPVHIADNGMDIELGV